MQLIKKIEIKYFRSFGDKKTEIIELKDINIFSGSNDCGKSNILRALNLFFNGEINTGIPFDIDRDFSKFAEKDFKDKVKPGGNVRMTTKFIKIKITFNNPILKRKLPKEFWVSKDFNKNKLTGELESEKQFYTNIKKEGNQKTSNKMTQVTKFIVGIEFKYIPAIKGKELFQTLFGQLQNSLFLRSKDLENSSKKFEKDVKNETLKLFEGFKEKTKINA